MDYTLLETNLDFKELYTGFDAPIAAFDCGDRCAPYNDNGVPFCCDSQVVIPSAYQAEWQYLKAHTDLWHPWQTQDRALAEELKNQTPSDQALIECKGYQYCQRPYRSISCRAFPFFPYITEEGEFFGLAAYWEYREECWLISHLEIVTQTYIQAFMRTFQIIFERMPEDKAHFDEFSAYMRAFYENKRWQIPILTSDGLSYQVSPKKGKMRRVDIDQAPKFGVYKIASEHPFPDEFNFEESQNGS